jgi:hypothetical protein
MPRARVQAGAVIGRLWHKSADRHRETPMGPAMGTQGRDRSARRGMRRRSPRRAWTTVPVAVTALALSACGTSGVARSPVHTAATSSHAHGAAAAGDRLAMAVSGTGVLIWSSEGGTTTVERASARFDVFSSPTWSADGRYLAWFEASSAAGSTLTVGVAVLDTTSDRVATLEIDSGLLGDPMVVAGGGVYFLDPNSPKDMAIRRFLPGGQSSAIAITGPASLAWNRRFGAGVRGLAPTSNGFLVAGQAAGSSASLDMEVFSVAVDGTSHTDESLRVPRGGLVDFSASPDGTTAAYLTPDPGDGPMGSCAVAMQLESVDLRSGATAGIELPDPQPGEVGRLAALDYGPGGTLDVVEYPCTTAFSGQIAPVRVLELRGRALVPIAGAAMQAQRSITGSLALTPARYVVSTSGREPLVFPSAVPTGPVRVDGRPLSPAGGSLDGAQLAWSPA